MRVFCHNTHGKHQRQEPDNSLVGLVRVDPQTIANIKGRIAQCRRLADFTTDEHVAKILLQMAEEAEADLRRMEACSGDGTHEIIVQADGPKARA